MAVTTNYGWTYPTSGSNPFFTDFKAFVDSVDAECAFRTKNLNMMGYSLIGNNISGGNLQLSSTSHGTKGKIYLGAVSYFDEFRDKVYLHRHASGTLSVPSDEHRTFFLDVETSAISADGFRGMDVGVTVNPGSTGGVYAIGGQVNVNINSDEHAGVLGFAYANGIASTGTKIWGGDFHAIQQSDCAGAVPLRGIEVGVHPRKADTVDSLGIQIQNIKNWGSIANFQAGIALKIEGATYDDRAGWAKYVQIVNGTEERFYIDETDIKFIKSSGNPSLILQGTGITQEAVLDLIGRAASANVQGRIWASSGSVLVMGSLTNHPVVVYANNNEVGRFDTAIADGETALLIRRNVGAAYSVQRVSMGVGDSGGTGYKLLRIPN